MFLILFVTFCVSLTTATMNEDELTLVYYEDEIFQLPEKYSVKATRMSLTSNIVEDFVYWKTNNSDRVDSNHGYVKSVKIYDLTRSDENNTYEYEVHPETDEYENEVYVCSSKISEDETFGVPVIEGNDFIMKDNETILGIEATRFEYEIKNDECYAMSTLWAKEVWTGDEFVWAPIRYETEEFETKSALLTNHEIWNFYDFTVNFDEDEVFDIKEIGCDPSNIVRVNLESEAVTKELKFINPDNDEHVAHVFNSFKSKFNSKYAHEEEHRLRKNIFKQNMRLIVSTNRQNLGYKLAVNQFADRTPEELKNTGYRKRAKGKRGNVPFPYTQTALKDLVEKLPENLDLRIKGLVSPVQDQDSCGSCWTFGATAAAEGALARSNGGTLMSLSNQALIDCAWTFGAQGCDGGSDSVAFEWMMKHGLPTEKEYGPYENKDGLCKIKNMSLLYPIKGYTDVTPMNTQALKVAVFQHGPLSVSINATPRLRLYSSGVLYDISCNAADLNHEVALVGYGIRDGELFWILKNSWGPYWGMDGYMLIAAKHDCGVAVEPTYVVF